MRVMGSADCSASCPRCRCTRPASTSPRAYIVLFVLVLIYVAIMAIRLSRIERELGELLELSERPPRRGEPHVGERARERGDSIPSTRSRRPHERAAGARHLAQDRPGRAARAPGVHRARSGGARRSG